MTTKNGDIPFPSNSPPITPLLFLQPYNILVFLAFYSPFVLSTITFSLSFLFQNFKGIIYLAFLLAVSLTRNYFIKLQGGWGEPLPVDRSICNAIQFSEQSNQTFSSFVFAFTFMYMCVPMFVNNEINFSVMVGLLIYSVFDVSMRIHNNCFKYDMFKYLFLDTLIGAGLSSFIVMLMYAGGSGKYLFFNEISSKEVCSRPNEETFKCSVYKNGELIGSANP